MHVCLLKNGLKKTKSIFIVQRNMIIYVYINVTYFFGRDIVRQSMVYVCSIKQLVLKSIHKT